MTALFLYWRIFIFEGSRNATDAGALAGSYLSDLRYMSIRLIAETAKDFLNTSAFAWFVMPYQLISSAQYSNLGIAILIAGLVVGLVFLYLSFFQEAGDWRGSGDGNPPTHPGSALPGRPDGPMRGRPGRSLRPECGAVFRL